MFMAMSPSSCNLCVCARTRVKSVLVHNHVMRLATFWRVSSYLDDGCIHEQNRPWSLQQSPDGTAEPISLWHHSRRSSQTSLVTFSVGRTSAIRERSSCTIKSVYPLVHSPRLTKGIGISLTNQATSFLVVALIYPGARTAMPSTIDDPMLSCQDLHSMPTW